MLSIIHVYSTNMHFCLLSFKSGLIPCKADEPLQGMELKYKKWGKIKSILESTSERTTIRS